MWRALTACLGLLATAGADVIVYPQKQPDVIAEEFRDMPASFGPELPMDGLRGFLVHGDPPDGCLPLAKPPTIDNITGKWFVIVARYNCSFEAKVRNAQAAGYDCAIVHNVNSTALEPMSAKNPKGIDIPSVFVNDLDGLHLAEKFIFTNGYYIMLNGELPFNINTHLLLPFAVVVVLCLTVILIFLIVKCIKDRRRARRHRLPSRALRKIPTCKFSKGDPYDTCAICLDDYQEGERLRVLPCAHAYHAKCVDPWLTRNRRVCPVCKRRVLAAGERRARHDSDTDDTEPLVDDTAPRHNDTQGGTFEPQRENPFVRAARFVARMRGRQDTNDTEHVVEPSEDNEQTEQNEEPVETDERAPLVRVVSERSRGRTHRTRGRRSRPARTDTAADTTDTADTTGREIGVAALPAPPTDDRPDVMNL